VFSRWFLTDDIPIALCIQFHLNTWLVGLSYLVATLASYTAFHLMHQVQATEAIVARRTWIVAAGVSMGLGIWAMHFIAMLAVDMPIPVGYDIGLTVLSACCAIIASFVALTLVQGNSINRLRLVPAGLILGGGIVLMHYVGMAAMRMAAHIYYNPWRFAISVLLAIALSTAALLGLVELPRHVKWRVLSPLLPRSMAMGLAIVLMHYAGMFATYFYPQMGARDVGVAVNSTVLAWTIGVISLTIIGFALAAALFESNRKRGADFTAQLLNSLPGYLALVDRTGRFARWNSNLSILTGLPDEQLQGLDASVIAAEKDRDAVRTKISQVFAEGFGTLEFGILDESGKLHLVLWNGKVVTESDQSFILASGRDVTETRAAEAQLRESEDRFRFIFAFINDGVIVHDAGTTAFIDANFRACEMFGYTREEFLKLGIADLSTGVPPYTLEDALPILKRVGSEESVIFDWHCRAKEGHTFWVEVSMRGAKFVDREFLLSTIRDITERRRITDKITRLASYDSLTGLVNRSVLVERLEGAIARGRRGGKGLAVLYLNLDHFKDVNDTLGRPVADMLLRAVADRLRASVRETDTVARFSGDEFAILLTDIQEPANAVGVSARIRSTVNEPLYLPETVIAAGSIADTILKALGGTFSIRGNTIRCGATIGIAVYGLSPTNAEAMLTCADLALHSAKAERRGTSRFYTDAMEIEVKARVALDAELREAITLDQLFLMYQPQVDIDTGRIVGLEALVRWHHPARGLLGPGTFIPAAEQNGLIIPLGRWVMREVCSQIKQWLDDGIAPPATAINLSVVQFQMAVALENDISAILTEFTLPPQILELELTESVLMKAAGEHNELLPRLRNKGHRIAIDDFGKGYSSLDYLRRYPVDRIKIDQSFIADIGTVEGNDAIVRAIIGLARELHLEVVAEGVETVTQLTLLKSWGCRIMQGYYLSRPLAVPEMTALLRAGSITSPGANRARLVTGA